MSPLRHGLKLSTRCADLRSMPRFSFSPPDERPVTRLLVLVTFERAVRQAGPDLSSPSSGIGAHCPEAIVGVAGAFH
jgi:hypothetical protein